MNNFCQVIYQLYKIVDEINEPNFILTEKWGMSLYDYFQDIDFMKLETKKKKENVKTIVKNMKDYFGKMSEHIIHYDIKPQNILVDPYDL